MSIRTLGTAAVWLLTAACAVNPATGRRELMLVSEEQEITLGRESDPAIVAQFGLVDDPALEFYVVPPARLGPADRSIGAEA